MREAPLVLPRHEMDRRLMIEVLVEHGELPDVEGQ